MTLAKGRRSKCIHQSTSVFFPGKFDWTLNTMFWCYDTVISETWNFNLKKKSLIIDCKVFFPWCFHYLEKWLFSHTTVFWYFSNKKENYHLAKSYCQNKLKYYSNMLQFCIVMLLKKICILIDINAYTQFVAFVKIFCVASQVQKYLRIPRKKTENTRIKMARL